MLDERCVSEIYGVGLSRDRGWHYEVAMQPAVDMSYGRRGLEVRICKASVDTLLLLIVDAISLSFVES